MNNPILSAEAQRRHVYATRDGKPDLTPLGGVNCGELSAIITGYRDAAHRAKDTGEPLPPFILHVHGGLVERNAGLDIARHLYKESYGSVGYPIFLVWESGFPAAFRDVMPRILRDALFKTLVERVSGFLARYLQTEAGGAGARGLKGGERQT